MISARLAICAALIALGTFPLSAAPVRLCNSTEFWPPYSFLSGDTLEGEHTAVLDAAFKDIGVDMEQIYLPWKRCQERAAAGEIDGIIGISYSTERGGEFHFPADATTDSPLDAISQVEFVIVTRADKPAPANISVAALPEPVGVLLGYRSAETVHAAGKRAQVVSQQSSLFHMLERGRVASAISLRGTAEHYVETSTQPLVIHEPALWTTPHFVAFSRNAGMTESDMQKIWAAIRTVRADKPRMAKIRAKVNAQLDLCYQSTPPCQ